MPFQIGFKYETAGAGNEVLQAPAPPPGIITSSAPSHTNNSASYATYTSAPDRQVRSLSPTKAHLKASDEERRFSSKSSQQNRRHSSVGSYFADLPRMAILCCCCPVYKCTLWGCFMELLISLFCWYKILALLAQTMDSVQLKDVFLIFVLTFWIVTLFTSTGMLMAAHKRKNASYVLPRMIQQIGLWISSVSFMVLLICYFTGARTTINGWAIWAYELFLENDLNPEDEREMARELNTIAMIALFMDFMFICYVSCGLCMTKRYHDKLKKKYGSGFTAISQNEQEPTAPPPASNPYYKA